jgi:hypothetical protein
MRPVLTSLKLQVGSSAVGVRLTDRSARAFRLAAAFRSAFAEALADKPAGRLTRKREIESFFPVDAESARMLRGM